MDLTSPSQTSVSSCKRLSSEFVTVKLFGGGGVYPPIGACAKVRCQHQVSSTVSTLSLRQFLTSLVRVTAHNLLAFTCVCLSPPQHKEYGHALPCSAFMGVLGIRIQLFMLVYSKQFSGFAPDPTLCFEIGPLSPVQNFPSSLS